MPAIIHKPAGGGGGGTDDQTASEVPVDTAYFDGNLSSIDVDVQTALETIDDLSIGGDVVGPGSSTDDVVALWDGTSGKLLSNSAISETDLTTLTDGSSADGLHTHTYAPIGAHYLTLAYDGQLTHERLLRGDTGHLVITQNSAGDEATIEIEPQGVGSYEIADDAVTNSELANMPTMTLKGNDDVITTDPQDLTVSEVKIMLDYQASEIDVDTTYFDNNLSSADNTVQAALETLDELAGGGGGGDVSGPGSSTDNAVALWDGTGGDTLSDSSIMESDLTTLTAGSSSDADALHTHDSLVEGPASAVDNRIVLFDGTSGKLVKTSDAFITGSSLTVAGNIILSTPSAQVDGVDISAHASDVNAHHSQTHGLNSHTQGSNKIFMTNGAVFTEIAVGTSGTYLKSQGPGADLIWDTPAGGSGAPTDAEYVVLTTDSDLSDERVLTAGTSLQLTDGGAGSTITIGVSNSGIDWPQIANDAVINGKLANMAPDRIKGRVTPSTGDPEDLTPAQVKTILDYQASDIDTDTSSFDNNLSAADDTVQKALDTLDDISMAGGDTVITDVAFTSSQTDDLGVDVNSDIADGMQGHGNGTIDGLTPGTIGGTGTGRVGGIMIVNNGGGKLYLTFDGSTPDDTDGFIPANSAFFFPTTGQVKGVTDSGDQVEYSFFEV